MMEGYERDELIGGPAWCSYSSGKTLHNKNGPSIIFDYGYPEGGGKRVHWYLHDKRHSFEEWCRLTNKTEDEVLLLKLKYGL